MIYNFVDEFLFSIISIGEKYRENKFIYPEDEKNRILSVHFC